MIIPPVVDLTEFNSSVTEINNPFFVEWVHDLGLSMADRDTLVNGKQLTANHIAAATKLLKKQFPYQNGLQDSHYVAENRWEGGVDGFVQIIFVSYGHWACLSNKLSKNCDVELFDSMLTAPIEGESIVGQACSILKSKKQNVTVDVVGVQTQVGGADCGLFAISMAFDICSGVDPFSQEVIQERMRDHLVSCLERGDMSSFPKVPRKSMDRRTRIINSVSVEIFCVCRGVEEGKMVMCDVCEEWFHSHCVSIPPKVFRNYSPSWTCPTCKSVLYMYVIIIISLTQVKKNQKELSLSHLSLDH